MAQKRIVVTGAAGTLGAAVTSHLALGGSIVIGIDRAEGTDAEVSSMSGVDLTNPAAAAAAMEEIGKGGPIDGLVNLAGGFRWETIAEGTFESWEWLHRINVATAFNASRAALPLLQRGGSIVNVGAAATLKAGLGMGAYTASKAGVAKLTEAMAEECKLGGIRVNAVLPSIIDTPANRIAMGEAEGDRWVQPRELASIIAFLLSSDASAITGACIPVTGRV